MLRPVDALHAAHRLPGVSANRIASASEICINANRSNALVTSSFLLLVMPGATSSVLATSSDALVTSHTPKEGWSFEAFLYLVPRNEVVGGCSLW